MTRGLMIAAPRSGSGKTTLTLGLLRALRRSGRSVVGVKSGPDYIDPAFHAAASGAPSVNLDSWAMPRELVETLAGEAARGRELLLCEASMGLFDGVPGETGRTGASADVAAALGLPVLLDDRRVGAGAIGGGGGQGLHELRSAHRGRGRRAQPRRQRAPSAARGRSDRGARRRGRRLDPAPRRAGAARAASRPRAGRRIRGAGSAPRRDRRRGRRPCRSFRVSRRSPGR